MRTSYVAAANAMEKTILSMRLLTESYRMSRNRNSRGEENASHETKEDEIIKEIHIPKALKEKRIFNLPLLAKRRIPR